MASQQEQAEGERLWRDVQRHTVPLFCACGREYRKCGHVRKLACGKRCQVCGGSRIEFEQGYVASLRAGLERWKQGAKRGAA